MERILAGLRGLSRRVRQFGPVRRFLYGLANAAEFREIYSHENMLADRARVDAYHAAISRHVRPTDTVLDLGTGSGILAMMAARQGATVLAIDQTPLIEMAEHVARANGLDHIIFHRTHSRDLDLDQKVDVILHEQIGDFLIDEDMIHNICTLRDQILAPGGRILPARFDAWLEPLSLAEGRGIPLLWEQNIHGIDFASARQWLAGHGEIRTCRPRYLMPGEAGAFLGEPEPAYRLDLETLKPDHVPSTVRVSRLVTRPGTIDGFVHYFRIRLDDEIGIENSPFDPQRMNYAHHWPPLLYPVDRTAVRPGDRVEAVWTIDNPTDPWNWPLEWRVERST